MPWKNGCGETAEIDRSPSGTGPYLWRLSQATIQADGPFSSFPGYDRWLSIWKGGSISLNGITVGPMEPIRFSGDDETYCKVAGAPVLDVGLIFDRSKIDAAMKVVEGKIELSQSGVHYIFDVESGDTMRFEDVVAVSVSRCLLISVWRISALT
jgi:environmental stress-induced protein Ves